MTVSRTGVFSFFVVPWGRGRHTAGFTLIELMITVAIVALLASIAYPAYTDAVLKGKRAEGRTALLNLMQQQERFFTQSGSYMTFAYGDSGNNGTIQGSSAAVTGQSIPFRTTSGDGDGTRSAYDLQAETCASGTLRECVRVRARPRRDDPVVGQLWVESSGAKGCSGSNVSACWK